MKILQITNKMPYPPKDGGAIATLNIAKGLAQLGNEVTILAMNTSKHYFHPDELPDELTRQITIKDVEVVTDICFWAAIRNLLFSSKPYNAERFFNKRFNEELVDLLQNQDFDIVQLEGLYLAFYIDTIRKHSKAQVSLRAHNIEHEIWERTALQEKSLWKRVYFNILARRIKNFKISMLNKYDLLIPITDRDAQRFDELGNTKPSFTLPVGYDIQKLSPQIKKIQFPSVCFIGTLDWYPNQEGLMWFVDQVWTDIRKHYPQIKFHVAGRNAPEWLSKKLEEHDNSIIYHGEVEDAHEFLHAYAVMVVPLFSGSGMRVKIVEGMALGKTIVTTPVGAEGIEVEDGRHIFIEQAPASFAQKVVELIGNRELFHKTGANAATFARERYDHLSLSRQLVDFYLKNKQ